MLMEKVTTGKMTRAAISTKAITCRNNVTLSSSVTSFGDSYGFTFQSSFRQMTFSFYEASQPRDRDKGRSCHRADAQNRTASRRSSRIALSTRDDCRDYRTCYFFGISQIPAFVTTTYGLPVTVSSTM